MKHLKKLLCAVLGASMLFSLVACGGNGNGSGDPANYEYGRYVEADITPPGMQGRVTSMQLFDDGVIEIFTNQYDFEKEVTVYRRYRSEDNGATWASPDMSWTSQFERAYDPDAEMQEEFWMRQVLALPNGDALVSVESYDPNENKNNSLLYRISSDGQPSPFAFAPLEELAAQDRNFSLSDFILLGNNRVYLDAYIYLTEEEWALADQTGDYSSNQVRGIFDLDTGEQLIDLADSYGWEFYYNSQYLFVPAEDGSLACYRLSDGQPGEGVPSVSAEQLDKLRMSNRYGGGMQYGESGILMDEENNIYTVSTRGVEKYVAGADTAEPELVMEGVNYSYGSPLAMIRSSRINTDSEFYVVLNYQDDPPRVIRLVYDPDAIASTDLVLRVYSLYESSTVRLALSEYKRTHPEVTLQYETAFREEDMFYGKGYGSSGGESGLTEEDAIKALNNELLSKKGPDVLILDGLPMQSYVKQGILEDVSDVVQDLDLFNSLLDPMRTNGKLYLVPTRVVVPTLIGDKGYVEQFTDFMRLSEAILGGPGSTQPDYANMTDEQWDEYYRARWMPLREEEQPVLGFENLDDLFSSFYDVLAPSVFTQGEGVSRENLTRALESMKAIAEHYDLLSETSGWGGGVAIMYASDMYSGSYQSYSSTLGLYTEHRSRLAFSNFSDFNALESLTWSVAYDHWAEMAEGGRDDGDAAMPADEEVPDEGAEGDVPDVDEPMPGGGWEEPTIDFEVKRLNPDGVIAPSLVNGVYYPSVIAGVTTTTKNMDLAKEFIAELLGSGVQNYALGDGLPISRAGFNHQQQKYTNSEYFAMERERKIVPIQYDYDALFAQASTPYYPNNYLRKVVGEAFEQYCQGQMDLDAAVNKIITETETYFGEIQ